MAVGGGPARHPGPSGEPDAADLADHCFGVASRSTARLAVSEPGRTGPDLGLKGPAGNGWKGGHDHVEHWGAAVVGATVIHGGVG